MALLIAGLLTGVIGGLFGVGGGEIFILLLVYLFGFSQHQAQGNFPGRSAAPHRPARGTAVLQGRARRLRYGGTPGTRLLLRRVTGGGPRSTDIRRSPPANFRGVPA